MLSLALAVASNPPLGLNATETGALPVPNGEPLTGVNAPSEATENTDTVLSSALAVASNPPLGLNATEYAKAPVANGEPLTGASTPPGPTENTDTRLGPSSTGLRKLVAASSLPFGLNATDTVSRAPVANGEPPTWLSVPSAPVENTDTVPGGPLRKSPVLLAVASSPSELNATESGNVPAPVLNGEPLICVNAGAAAHAPGATAKAPATAKAATTETRRLPPRRSTHHALEHRLLPPRPNRQPIASPSNDT